MYPWTIVSDNIYPKHLGPEWNEGIKQSYFYRKDVLKPQLKKLKKGTEAYDDVDSDQAAYKLSLNGGGFGKLGSEFSWQCDTLEKFKVTIGGELKMLMLIEELYIANIELISVNTDGVVIHYSEKQREKVLEIWKKWESITTYTLEDTYYKQIIFSSVNDYLAEIIDKDSQKTLYFKYKGDFEIDKEWHKNSSQRIVPLALKRYFVNNIPVEETIYNHLENGNYEDNIKNYGIYDFCLGKKKQKNQEYVLTGFTEKIIKDKVIRYYISNKGNKLFKKYIFKHINPQQFSLFDNYEPVSYEAVNKGFYVELFQDFEKKENYNINYDYYVLECKKIINSIKNINS